MFETLKDNILLFGRILAEHLIVPVLAFSERSRLRLFETFTQNGIRRALQIDEKKASNIYRQSVRNFTSLGVDFFFLSRLSQHATQVKVDGTKVIGEKILSEVFASSRPVLIITIYMGNFPLGFLKLMSTVPNDRKIFAFKVNDQTSNEDALFSMFRAANQNIEPLRAGEEGGKRAFLELRKRNVVAMMVDAEVHVKSRENVSFLNHNCPMQSGPAILAALTKSVILPIINYHDSDGQLVAKVEPPIDPEEFEGMANKELISRLTQCIAEKIEGWIHIDPAQVQRWGSIAEIISRGKPIGESSLMRLATPSDIPWIISLTQNREDRSFMALASPHGFSESELKVVFSQGHLFFLPEDQSNEVLLSLHDIDAEHGQARVQFYALDSSYAPKDFLRSLMRKHRISRFISYVFPDEKGEIRVLTKLGFIQEAVFREHVFHAGSYRDIVVFGWQEKQI